MSLGPAWSIQQPRLLHGEILSQNMVAPSTAQPATKSVEPWAFSCTLQCLFLIVFPQVVSPFQAWLQDSHSD